jgi:hypothetical protein
MKRLVRTSLKYRGKALNSFCSRAPLKLLLVLVKQITCFENFSKQTSERAPNPKQRTHLTVLAKLESLRLMALIHSVYQLKLRNIAERINFGHHLTNFNETIYSSELSNSYYVPFQCTI